ncbi:MULTISPECIES: sigma D regulator [unclassified Moritella]|uniref:sigma D regulator n=1 Tax=unclassified Moritella TaxID=2637987 RepID=UPI001BA9B35D|nr:MULTISPECIES: sigma D regulator [unclassified Moritella]QUM85010.1 sigma D regulator [Moritella sp. 28]QUM89242.1 sigma D regulator [Moritella sp. 36]
MLTRNKKAVLQWEGKNELIDFLLSRRHNLIVNYYKIAGLPPFSQDKRTLPTSFAIEEFCNTLVDYISMGHFEIYDALIARYEMNGKLCPEELQLIMLQISETTSILLYFTDKYSELSDLLLNELDSDLAILMGGLDQRFELENKLIAALFEQVTQTA